MIGCALVRPRIVLHDALLENNSKMSSLKYFGVSFWFSKYFLAFLVKFCPLMLNETFSVIFKHNDFTWDFFWNLLGICWDRLLLVWLWVAVGAIRYQNTSYAAAALICKCLPGAILLALRLTFLTWDVNWAPCTKVKVICSRVQLTPSFCLGV